MLGSLILYLKGMRIMMFQLSGFYCNIIEKVNLCWARVLSPLVGHIQQGCVWVAIGLYSIMV